MQRGEQKAAALCTSHPTLLLLLLLLSEVQVGPRAPASLSACPAVSAAGRGAALGSTGAQIRFSTEEKEEVKPTLSSQKSVFLKKKEAK